MMGIAPPIAVVIAKHPLALKTDLSSMKYILCGAAPLADSVLEEVMRRMPQVKVMQGTPKISFSFCPVNLKMNATICMTHFHW